MMLNAEKKPRQRQNDVVAETADNSGDVRFVLCLTVGTLKQGRHTGITYVLFPDN